MKEGIAATVIVIALLIILAAIAVSALLNILEPLLRALSGA